jgi:hypothetical protein
MLTFPTHTISTNNTDPVEAQTPTLHVTQHDHSISSYSILEVFTHSTNMSSFLIVNSIFGYYGFFQLIMFIIPAHNCAIMTAVRDLHSELQTYQRYNNEIRKANDPDCALCFNINSFLVNVTATSAIRTSDH